MPTRPATLEQYLSTLNDEQRSTIEAMRDAVVAAAPKADVVFSYNMPGFRLHGQPLLWVAAWKHHFSIYPLTKTMIDAHAAALEPYEMSKGTLRFPASALVPLSLIRKLVKTRAAEIRSKAAQ